MKSAESELSLQLTIELLKNLPAGIVVSDSDDKIIWCNDALADILSESSDSIAGQSLEKLKHSKLRPITETADTVLVPGNEKNSDRW